MWASDVSGVAAVSAADVTETVEGVGTDVEAVLKQHHTDEEQKTGNKQTVPRPKLRRKPETHAASTATTAPVTSRCTVTVRGVAACFIASASAWMAVALPWHRSTGVRPMAVTTLPSVCLAVSTEIEQTIQA